VVTGRKIPLSDVLRHHIRHDQYGRTIKTDCRFVNLVATIISSNAMVEGTDWFDWQVNLTIAQVYLDSGLLSPHWLLQDQRDFMREARGTFGTIDWFA